MCLQNDVTGTCKLCFSLIIFCQQITSLLLHQTADGDSAFQLTTLVCAQCIAVLVDSLFVEAYVVASYSSTVLVAITVYAYSLSLIIDA